ncbi:MAG: 7-cyano-7-deazaguanine synthase QueC [Nitrospiraceae bacterium]|nr:MAG: 7-cyano-7-deazaguanine synthase QueC [Nitrospiraceae bacterium]
MKRAVVLLSGGVDSTTTLAAAKAEGFEVFALSFDYGQRHKIELELARRTADKFSVIKHLIINFDLREIGGSALTSDIEVPKDRTQNSELRTQSEDVIPVTYVPARNTIFLSFALAWAETLEAEDIFIGANAIDYSGYPDCRPEFIQAFEDMANLATKISVEGKVRFKIRAPLIKLTKAEIIKEGTALGVDYSLTWSCYDPLKRNIEALKRGRAEANNVQTSGLPDFCADYIPCLKCDSCLIRAKGFSEAGINDPLLGDI